MRKFFEVRFFYFASSESSFLKYKKNIKLESFISGNIRNFLLLELERSISRNKRIFLILELESSISREIWEIFSGWIFVYFFQLGLKSGPGSCILYRSLQIPEAYLTLIMLGFLKAVIPVGHLRVKTLWSYLFY